MKVKDLIAMLQKADLEADVRTFDGESQQFEPVTGMVYGDGPNVDLYTDEP